MMATQITAAGIAIDELLTVATSPRITIVMPIDHTDPRNDGIRIRSLLKRVGQLAEQEPGLPDVSEVVDRLPDLVTSAHPIPRSMSALGLYAAPGFQRMVPFHGNRRERVRVGAEFDLIPLIDEADPAYCHLLTITRSGSRLWLGHRHGIESIELENAPSALSDVTWYRDLETQLQLHQTGGGAAMFHGQGVDEDGEIEPLRTYMRAIDAAVAAVVPDAVPMQVVGPGRLPSIYREVTRHHEFLPNVDSHPDGLSLERLRDLAMSAATDLAARRTADLLETVGDLSGAGRSSRDPSEVLAAGAAGRIETVLVSPSATDPGAIDAVVTTLRHGGTAVPIVGSDVRLAAIHRW